MFVLAIETSCDETAADNWFVPVNGVRSTPYD
jgi:hypothetical protein